MSSTRRVARNTLMLYVRQLLIMAVSLYTVRAVLAALGTEDYGIYSVVAGVVTMFGFLSGAMASATQRYFAFDLGRNDTAHLKRTFGVTLQMYLLLAAVTLTLAETVGLWFVNTRLVIPAGRLAAANGIYQCAVISFLCTLVTAPYMAAIVAHEKMSVYAAVSVVEAALRLGSAFLLRAAPGDKLALYGILTAASSFVTTAIYRASCRHWPECRFRPVRDRMLFREILGYSGWNLFGACAGIAKNQLTNILLNLRFGAAVNAARGIASSVMAAAATFSQNFSTALRPQIIKSYASGDRETTMRFVFRGCKFTFFLMHVVALPLIIEMDAVLALWLGNPPPHAATFARLALADVALDSISYPIMTLAQATGRIRLYQGAVGGLLLLNLPVSWVVLRLGAPAWSVMAVALTITVLAAPLRLLIVRKLTAFSARGFARHVALPCAALACVSAVLSIAVRSLLADSVLRLPATVAVSCLASAVCMLAFGMTTGERSALFSAILSRLGGSK